MSDCDRILDMGHKRSGRSPEVQLPEKAPAPEFNSGASCWAGSHDPGMQVQLRGQMMEQDCWVAVRVRPCAQSFLIGIAGLSGTHIIKILFNFSRYIHSERRVFVPEFLGTLNPGEHQRTELAG